MKQAKCTNCGAALVVDETKDCAICQYCGVPFITEKAIAMTQNTTNNSAQVINNYYAMPNAPMPNPQSTSQPKLWLTTLLLCIFVGIFGGHRFYTGKNGTAIVWFCTFGCFGLGWFIDLFLIIIGAFRDGEGHKLQ